MGSLWSAEEDCTDRRGKLADHVARPALPAELGPRLLARLIDAALLWAAFLILIVPTLIVGRFDGSFRVGAGLGAFEGSRFVVSVVWTLVILGYFSGMEWRRGQTVGKMLMRLRTRGPAGERPSLEMAINRNLWNVVSVVPVVGGLLGLAIAASIAISIGRSPTRTGWHDRFAGGTQVVDAG